MADQVERSDNHAVTHQRNTKERAYFAERYGFGQLVVAICGNVGDMHDLSFESYAPDHTVAARYKGVLLQKCEEFALEGVARSVAKTLALAERHARIFGTAQVSCRLDQSVEHPLQVEGRAADDLERVAGRG